VSLHPTDTKEAADAMCRVGRKVRRIQRMDGAADNVATHERNENGNCTIACNVNGDTANTRRPRRWGERNEITKSL
jgi:hypothetical protein